MGEIKNTQGATSGEVRAPVSGEDPVGSSSLQDCDPSRNRGKAGVLIFSKKLQEFWLAPGEGTTPLSREAHVYDMEDAKSRLCGVWDRYELRSADGAQAIEARQGGDAEGGSVEDKSAVAEGDVPASKSEDQPPSSTPGEAERLVDALIAAAKRVATERTSGELGGVFAASNKLNIARTALLTYISTAGRGEGAGDLAALSKKATPSEWSTFVNRLVGDHDGDGWSTIAETPAPASTVHPPSSQDSGVGETEAEHQRDCLIEFLHSAGVRLGVINPNVAFYVPHLMAAMDAYFDHLAAAPRPSQREG